MSCVIREIIKGKLNCIRTSILKALLPFADSVSGQMTCTDRNCTSSLEWSALLKTDDINSQNKRRDWQRRVNDVDVSSLLLTRLTMKEVRKKEMEMNCEERKESKWKREARRERICERTARKNDRKLGDQKESAFTAHSRLVKNVYTIPELIFLTVWGKLPSTEKY